METTCEDYGQIAIYNGTLTSPHQHSYVLDDHHTFEVGRPVLVCGNTASMLQDSWMRQHFTIIGNRKVHYGKFACTATATASASGSNNPACRNDSAACCS